MKATEQYFPVVLFIVLYKLVEPVGDSTEFIETLSSPSLFCKRFCFVFCFCFYGEIWRHN